MRRIEKGELPARVFIEGLLSQIEDSVAGYHPDYSDGDFRKEHYLSVFFSLLGFQKGLCAYTESVLSINPTLLNSANCFEDGKLKKEIVRKGIDADIDHYDPSLKKNYGWEIDNLFLCRVFINRDIKRDQATLPILKPDNPDYSPEKYLRYNFLTHRFVANPEIEDGDLKRQITHQIDHVLGINAETIIAARSTMFSSFLPYIVNGFKTFEDIRDNELQQFFTAFEMSREELTGGN